MHVPKNGKLESFEFVQNDGHGRSAGHTEGGGHGEGCRCGRSEFEGRGVCHISSIHHTRSSQSGDGSPDQTQNHAAIREGVSVEIIPDHEEERGKEDRSLIAGVGPVRVTHGRN
mmetsp:Transcript_35027/g.39939  ORF Transcript_35027/g.39939 Transcript_35027/m.39939 type:complete len:114 (+) Transcript_35027:573-914(+)